MKILVFDESPINQESARLTLKGHDLTIATSYDSAKNFLTPYLDWGNHCAERARMMKEAGIDNPSITFSKLSLSDQQKYREVEREFQIKHSIFPKFDVFMTHLFTSPPSSANEVSWAPIKLPYGLVLALLAVSSRIKRVACCYDYSIGRGDGLHPMVGALGSAFASQPIVTPVPGCEETIILCQEVRTSFPIHSETGEVILAGSLASQEGREKYPKKADGLIGVVWKKGRDWNQALEWVLNGRHE